jgi:hypothetical protein
MYSNLRRSGFDPSSIYLRFVLVRVGLGQVFLGVYTLVFSYQYHSTVFIQILLLLQGQMDEGWKPFKKQFSFESRGTFDRNIHLFSLIASEHRLLEVSMHSEGTANGQINRCIS